MNDSDVYDISATKCLNSSILRLNQGSSVDPIPSTSRVTINKVKLDNKGRPLDGSYGTGSVNNSMIKLRES